MTNPKDRDRLIEADRAWRDKVASVEAREQRGMADGAAIREAYDYQQREFERTREGHERLVIEMAEQFAELAAVFAPNEAMQEATRYSSAQAKIATAVTAVDVTRLKAAYEAACPPNCQHCAKIVPAMDKITTAADAARMRAAIMREAKTPIMRNCTVCHHEHLVGPTGRLVCGGDNGHCYCKAEDHN